ncbi:GNAT family N-acetyltransferase [uncultured Roseibium sp.]|uniref:GNAT family N-acetyltransferase n=1 Tax=uncultured Roseibium sp. TaxID=1936171 RepID=UPI0026314E05|nr:GNAT family N-acetyltransferase [uncultured Roseibium sp.]
MQGSCVVTSAQAADAEEIAEVLRRSIAELCVADHFGEASKLEPWVANKTARNVLLWIEGPDLVVTAHRQSKNASFIAGVGMASATGEVLLNYVHPDARLTGVSKVIMLSLEDHLRKLGLAKARLTSTVTAERFYRSIGYIETGDARSHRGVVVRDFEKVF